jgi:large subunit ribosomal protein L18
MIKQKTRSEKRIIRHERIRRKIFGSVSKPRISIFISLKHVYAQLIDDEKGQTLISASTLEKELKEMFKGKNKTESAKVVGKIIAERALQKGISAAVFDRGGFQYHGRVKAFADEARSAGLKF